MGGGDLVFKEMTGRGGGGLKQRKEWGGGGDLVFKEMTGRGGGGLKQRKEWGGGALKRAGGSFSKKFAAFSHRFHLCWNFA